MSKGKHSDYVICVRRGGVTYTVYDLEGELEANGHKHALQRFLLSLDAPYKILRVVPVGGGLSTIYASLKR
ncbi:MAG: hypothetical protein F4246_05885 [Rhodothermaceae bacterium]|nr:hypothetical protein [Rhodothermaceae bacterium]MXX59574.1 hypothetical protein [Rhodothermaceae bacterium]MYD18380.1 hypothetical protein [Rhodothermaceae bacterium]MYD56525.1 hypothetical protein [Rhodothermaceae bacterium]MYI43170.1 hypothetical protein [Rhodothermaceae bacterium]